MNSTGRYADFARRCAAAMADKGTTAADLSGALQISTQMVGKYLRGESLPGPERLKLLSGLLDVPVGELIGDVGVVIRKERTPQAVSRYMEPAASVRAETRRFEREAVEVVADAMTAFCRRVIRERRPDLAVVPVPRVEGPFFMWRPDVLIDGRDGPTLAIEVKTTTANIPALVGVAYNWRKAAQDAPLFLAIVGDVVDWGASAEPGPDTAKLDRLERLRDNLRPIVASGLIRAVGYDVMSSSPRFDPEGETIAALHSAIGDAMGAAKPRPA